MYFHATAASFLTIHLLVFGPVCFVAIAGDLPYEIMLQQNGSYSQEVCTILHSSFSSGFSYHLHQLVDGCHANIPSIFLYSCVSQPFFSFTVKFL